MKADVLVIGSGIAGLVFSLKMARFASVAIVTKKGRVDTNTNYAQGGIAAVFHRDDSYALHFEDTVAAGAGLCHSDVVRVLVREGPARVGELIDWGVRFTREAEVLSLGREGGHSRRRIVRADDLTGREIERALLAAVAESPNISVYEDHAALDLLTVGAGADRRCCGAVVLPSTGSSFPVHARAVFLATGGCGQVYRHTTNPPVATGDGIAIAYRAGARIANLEFIQFHPTALYPAHGDTTLLISEAVRGEGGALLRANGEPLMEHRHALGSLAPRDVVARVIDEEMKQSGTSHVLLDCTRILPSEVRSRFPNILKETAARGIDILTEPLPVVPAAHYACGGVVTDTHGQTTLPGLFAAGETACTGVHGANRLASNSLLEAVVFAHRAVARIRDELCRPIKTMPEDSGFVSSANGSLKIESTLREEVRDLMWRDVGIVRNDADLAAAGTRLNEMVAAMGEVGLTQEDAEIRSLVLTASLIVRCARARAESRGLHFNQDHPRRNNERFLRDTVLVQ
ncbi:L-aspartate oxidase [soil metagenome]